MNLLFLLGTAVLAGFFGGRLMEFFRIPRVVGFIVAGILLGDSFSGLLKRDLLVSLMPLTHIALGFIGFMVGGELKADVFKKYGRQLSTILFFEGCSSALAVALAVSLFTGRIYLGILLGALASATAPAATVDVLWEYRAKGPLTTAIFSIVALDDGLALVLYGFAITFAELLLGGEPFSISLVLLGPIREILGSILLGASFGWAACQLLRIKLNARSRLSFFVAMILLISGLAPMLGFSLILANMSAGFTLANLLAEREQEIFDRVDAFTPPIYILFFVLVGARLQIGLFSTLGIIGLVYITGRTFGKIAGAWLGGLVSHAPEGVRKYLGFALFSQAGVAVGLSLDIAHRLSFYGRKGVEAGNLILNVIAVTTFVVQIIGPPFVKYAVRRAGEIKDPGIKPMGILQS